MSFKIIIKFEKKIEHVFKKLAKIVGILNVIISKGGILLYISIFSMSIDFIPLTCDIKLTKVK